MLFLLSEKRIIILKIQFVANIELIFFFFFSCTQLMKRPESEVRNIWFLSPFVPSKREKN